MKKAAHKDVFCQGVTIEWMTIIIHITLITGKTDDSAANVLFYKDLSDWRVI